MAGGIKTEDTAVDLAIVAALLSSKLDIAIDSKDCFAGEISLSGEIRPVSRIEQRIGEAKKLGYKRIFVAGNNTNAKTIKGIEVVNIPKLLDLPKHLFV